MKVITYADDKFIPMAQICASSFQAHNNQRPEVVLINQFSKNGKPDHFHKLRIIIEYLSKGESIFYVDADVVCLRPLPLTRFRHGVAMAPDYGGRYAPWLRAEMDMLGIPYDKYLNAGVIFATPEALVLFRAAIQFYEKNADRIDARTADQTCLNHMLNINIHRKPECSFHLEVLGREWNWVPGKAAFTGQIPYLVHLAGIGNRNIDFREWLAWQFHDCNPTEVFVNAQKFPFPISLAEKNSLR